MKHQFLGDYRIIKELGAGTLGQVLMAEHRFIKQKFVLKVLPEELSCDQGFIDRFTDEIAKLAELTHPHCVKIHNVSYSEGLYFLVTDCIVDSIGETTNLGQYMAGRGERLREEELWSLLQEIAAALDHAHGKGMIHGSLKLNNILVGKGRPGIDVFISDFGLAKIIGNQSIVQRSFKAVEEVLFNSDTGVMEKYSPLPFESSKLSAMNQSFVQNFAFMSPEQKKMQQLSVASDIYAFGILAYYLIAGFFPEGYFPMPSQLAPDYKHDWDKVIQNCLQLLPEKRATRILPLLERKERIGFVEQPVIRPIIAQEIEKEEPVVKFEAIAAVVAPPAYYFRRGTTTSCSSDSRSKNHSGRELFGAAH